MAQDRRVVNVEECGMRAGDGRGTRDGVKRGIEPGKSATSAKRSAAVAKVAKTRLRSVMCCVAGRSRSRAASAAVQLEKTSVSERRPARRGMIDHTVRACASLLPSAGGGGAAMSFSECMCAAAPVE